MIRLLFLLVAVAESALGFDSSLVAENTNRPTTFAGVPWGADPEEAMRILNGRAGAAIPEELPSDQSKIELGGGTFSGQPVEKWTLEFVKRKLFAATVTFKNDAPATNRFRDLKQMLTAKYGPILREGKPPIGIGADKKDRRAVQRNNPGQALFGNTAMWKFTPTLKDKEPKTIELTLAAPGGILATDEAQLTVSLRYVNEALLPAATAGKATPPTKAPGLKDL